MSSRLLFAISMALLATTAVTGCAGKKVQQAGKPSSYVEGNYSGHLKIGKPYEIEGRRYVPAHNPVYTEEGVASWYGPGFHGRSTANGERFDQNGMTAAHRTLPMPSMVRVTNLENGKSAVLKVNDRGPFKKDRIIDLSKGAAQHLGVMSRGTARVRVEFLPQETRELITQLVANNKLKPTPDTMTLLALNDIPEGAVASDADSGSFRLVASANAMEPPAAQTPGVVREASLTPVLSRDLAPPPGMGAPITPQPVRAAGYAAPASVQSSASVQSIPVQASEPAQLASAPEQPAAPEQHKVQEIQIARIERAAPESAAPRTYEQGGVVPSVMPSHPRKMAAPSSAPMPPAASAPGVTPAPETPSAPQPRELQPVPGNSGDAPLYAPGNDADSIAPQTKYQISKDGVFIQAGSFSKEQNAQDLSQRLKRVGQASVKPIEIAGQTWYRVQVGPLADMRMARTALHNLHGMGLHDAHVLNKN